MGLGIYRVCRLCRDALGLRVRAWSTDSKVPWASGVILVSFTRGDRRNEPRSAEWIPCRVCDFLGRRAKSPSFCCSAWGDLPPDKALGVKCQAGADEADRAGRFAVIAGIMLSCNRDGCPRPAATRFLAGQRQDRAGARNTDRRRTVAQGGRSSEARARTLLPPRSSFPPDDATSKLFPAVVPSVLHSWLVRGSADELRDEKFRSHWKRSFPPRNFAWVTPVTALEPRT